MAGIKTYNVIILPIAIGELKEITDYIRIWSPQNGNNLSKEVFEKINDLQIFPRRYSIEMYSTPDDELRSFTYKNLKIIYFIDDSKVTVLSIVHGSRNPARIAKIKKP